MINIPQSHSPRIVIIGGGFGGITITQKLKNKDFQVVLLDRNNYHNFQPLMYQVATGGLEEGSITYPIRKLLQGHNNIFFRLANVEQIDTENNLVITDIGSLSYDYLVIATGSTNNFFGNKNIEKYSLVMKTIPQAIALRSTIIEAFEQALQTNDAAERRMLLNFIIVGAGPTGVELAGALAEMKRAIFPKDYPELDIKNEMQITLIQGADRVLNTMSEKSSAVSNLYLRKLGINVYTDIIVKDYDGETITTNTEQTFTSKTVIWSAGVKGNYIKGVEKSLNPMQRIEVDEFSRVKGFSNIFAIGDVAAMYSDEYRTGHPMMVQPAIQQGALLAKNIERLVANQELITFKYNDKGAMATIGRNKAVVDLPSIHMNGFLAWFVWVFVHLISLIGFKNKVLVFWSWVYNYLFFDRETRIIIKDKAS